MPRLFTGLEIPQGIADRLSFLRGGLPGARWIEPSDYHITLRFIGDIDDRLADDIAETLAAIRRKPLTLRLTGLDVFGRGAPKSVHALVEPTSDLAELQAEHERRIRRLGLEAEPRRFTPHVTLARFSKDVRAHDVGQWLVSRSPFSTAPFQVGRFVLFSSRASVGGGPYLVEEAYPLVAA